MCPDPGPGSGPGPGPGGVTTCPEPGPGSGPGSRARKNWTLRLVESTTSVLSLKPGALSSTVRDSPLLTGSTSGPSNSLAPLSQTSNRGKFLADSSTWTCGTSGGGNVLPAVPASGTTAAISAASGTTAAISAASGGASATAASFPTGRGSPAICDPDPEPGPGPGLWPLTTT